MNLMRSSGTATFDFCGDAKYVNRAHTTYEASSTEGIPQISSSCGSQQLKRRHDLDLRHRRRGANLSAGKSGESSQAVADRLCHGRIQRLSHVRQQGGWGEGFLEKQTVLVRDAVALDRFGSIARYVDELDVWTC